eukprot:CAMPEP_0172624192 /NCGR_PEP_ID=MMETSP1068-20121228/134528_1 /TAXON_ID=35684 /ORGANISM="Pseudopedinella elastica, Strain CCMP716" /LENGTH=67 /DNA_ID=CAMNT_0013433039 /DNA_START=50 /DNA_END=250 /DNA_ORIENTATION=-
MGALVKRKSQKLVTSLSKVAYLPAKGRWPRGGGGALGCVPKKPPVIWQRTGSPQRFGNRNNRQIPFF